MVAANVAYRRSPLVSKTYGNTYHSVRIFEGNYLLVTLPYQYGYGDQFLQTALDWLKAKGHVSKDAK